MKASELIDLLNKFDGNAPVCVESPYGPYNPVSNVEIIIDSHNLPIGIVIKKDSNRALSDSHGFVACKVVDKIE